MNATIDIKTPSGKSLEGFPLNVDSFDMPSVELRNEGKVLIWKRLLECCKYDLHPGDTITITIV